MLENIARIFQRRDPQQEAAMALARISTLSEMNSLPWQTGIEPDRRVRPQKQTVLGVWLMPCSTDQLEGSPETLSFSEMQRGVCADLRATGFGVLLPADIPGDQFVIALPVGGEGLSASWKFFVVDCRHRTPRPGHWCTMGVELERVYEPTELQRREFADLVA